MTPGLQTELVDALECLLSCLTSWMELADPEDERDYDYEAVRKARAVLAKTKGVDITALDVGGLVVDEQSLRRALNKQHEDTHNE